MDQDFDLQAQDELLSKQLTGDELREVLERLGSTEFAMNDFSTVRDVVEGTGANPVAIGRTLAEIRKQDFEERFAEAFGDHDKRITELETKASRQVPTTVTTMSPSTPRASPGLNQHQKYLMKLLWATVGVTVSFTVIWLLIWFLTSALVYRPR